MKAPEVREVSDSAWSGDRGERRHVHEVYTISVFDNKIGHGHLRLICDVMTGRKGSHKYVKLFLHGSHHDFTRILGFRVKFYTKFTISEQFTNYTVTTNIYLI